MATYYWVGGAGTWNTSTTTNWAISSGGGGGTGVPTAADNVIIDTSSGTGTITCTSAVCNDITVTASQAIILGAASSTLTVSGSMTLPAGGSFSASTNANTINFNATSTGKTITTNGKNLSAVTWNSATGEWTLVDALTTTSSVNLLAGILTLNNNILTCTIFASTNTATRAIAFGTGKIVLTGSSAGILRLDTITNFSYTGTGLFEATYSGSVGTRGFFSGITGGSETNAVSVNVIAGTDTINTYVRFKNIDLTGFSGTFNSLALSGVVLYGNLKISTGTTITSSGNTLAFSATSGTQQITSNNKTLDFPITFNGTGGTFAFQDTLTQGSTRAFTITNGTVQLKDGVTSTVGSFVANNTATKFLQSTTPGSQATLSQTSGTVNVADLNIRDINATGGASWNAYTDFDNTDAGNNDGWNFSLSPPYSIAELPVTLRPFTQPRRF
jgi:hypothetical protein